MNSLFTKEYHRLLMKTLHLVRRANTKISSASLKPDSASSSASGRARARKEETKEEVKIRPYKDIPGPKPLPIIGNVWRFLPIIGRWGKMDLKELFIDLHKTYGKIVKLSGMPENRDMVFVYDANEIEKVFRHEGPMPKRNAFESLDYYRRVMNKTKFDGAQGLLTTNGVEWQEFRRNVQVPLLQPRAISQYTDSIDDVATDFVERLTELRDSSGQLPNDAIHWFFRWALESVAVVALDTRLGCLDEDVREDSDCVRLINAVNILFDSMYELDVRPSIWRFMATPTWRRYVKALDTFDEISEGYIQQAIDRMEAKMEEEGELGDDLSILEKLLLSNDNPRVAVTMASDMMFAGIETTSYSVAILLYLLSMYPEKQELLYQELEDILPGPSSPITTENLKEMKYLKAAIRESMRLKPVVNGQIRENTKDGLVLGNYSIPKGVDVVLASSVTGNSSEYFPEAERFLPERWLKGDAQEGKGHPFASLPFGFGSRVCVGKRFAELEIEVIIAKIIRQFRVEYPGIAKFENRFVHMMTSPLNFRLTDRKSFPNEDIIV